MSWSVMFNVWMIVVRCGCQLVLVHLLYNSVWRSWSVHHLVHCPSTKIHISWNSSLSEMCQDHESVSCKSNTPLMPLTGMLILVCLCVCLCMFDGLWMCVCATSSLVHPFGRRILQAGSVQVGMVFLVNGYWGELKKKKNSVGGRSEGWSGEQFLSLFFVI